MINLPAIHVIILHVPIGLIVGLMLAHVVALLRPAEQAARYRELLVPLWWLTAISLVGHRRIWPLVGGRGI